jgi:hypothetical protein
MKTAALLVFTIAVLALFATACGSSRQATTTQSQPKWVTNAEGLVWSMLYPRKGSLGGHPKPASISYHRGQKTLRVTLKFNRTVNCYGCPGGDAMLIRGRIVPPRQPIHGRVATITLDPRTHRMTSFSLGRR